MKFTIQIKFEDDSTPPLAVARIERTDPLSPATLGLTLDESKELLAKLQKELVVSQFEHFVQNQRICGQCSTRRTIKDYHNACFKSLFGGVTLRVPRLNKCPCDSDAAGANTVKINGLANWVSPELELIQSKLAATIPYARSAALLRLLLPASAGNAISTVRRRTIKVGERLNTDLHESSTAPSDVNLSPNRNPVTAVGLDSGYIKDCRPQSTGSFEVVVGRIINKRSDSRSLGFVRAVESNRAAGHRLKQRLSECGKASTGVPAFTDGDPGLRRLLLSALPKANHILDWFHLTRRLTALKTILFGKEAVKHFPTEYHDPLTKNLESLKWRLWHGRPGGAINRIRAILFTLRLPTISCKRPAIRMRRRIKELLRYLQNNQGSMANYGRRYRGGQRISTAFVESAVNQLIDKRMSKSQQMRWSPMGAHALLQVRAELVDGRLDAAFARWYPGDPTI